MISKNFEHLGWFLEYMSGSTYLGTLGIDEPDRDKVGYYSKINHVAEEDFVLPNKRVIKKGQEYFTRLYPLCGKAIKK